MRISDWSSDVCSSDLNVVPAHRRRGRREDDFQFAVVGGEMVARVLYGLCSFLAVLRVDDDFADAFRNRDQAIAANAASAPHLEFSVTKLGDGNGFLRSEEHTSELQSLMRISYAVICLKKKKTTKISKMKRDI